jgi:hypothetical protein
MDELGLMLLKSAYEGKGYQVNAGSFSRRANVTNNDINKTENDINKLKILCSRHGTFSAGYGDLSWYQFTLNADGIKYYENSLNAHNKTPAKIVEQSQDIQPPQPETNGNKDADSKLKYTYSDALKNYQFWNSINDKIQGHANIFKNVTEQQFFEMIDNADFSVINKRNISQRVKYNIVVLSRLLGKEWGEKAAKKLNTTLRDCGKKTEIKEYEDIKGMYLQ